MRTGKGFTLIESVLALGIGIAIIGIVLPLINVLSKTANFSTHRQNFIGIIQLRQILSLGREFTLEGDGLCMEFGGENTCFYEVNGMLVQTPGTQAYLIEIETAQFEIKEGILRLNYTSEDSQTTINLIEIIN